MTSPVISVRDLGKRYHLGGRHSHDTLRDRLAHGARDLMRRLAGGSGNGAGPEVFWALKDVSFDVMEGEVVGVIGRNGAGKSTLLKILSQITEPTTGEARISGRVASLIEVGTGFHPELTGRENVYLNGAILGMPKAEIRAKFDEIVAFAEVERFLDTPVKRYSSGMYMRLAFAVAAHLEPEILVVDEVLAVGDLEFQRKCLRKMQDVASGGRTVLFVSHNMSVVQTFCTKGVLLSKGQVVSIGEIDRVLADYVRLQKSGVNTLDLGGQVQGRLGNGRARFASMQLEIEEGIAVTEVPYGTPFTVRGQVRNSSGRQPHLSIAFAIARAGGEIIFTSHHDDHISRVDFDGEVIEWRAAVNPNILKPGAYSIYLGLTDGDWNAVDYLPECMIFEILPFSMGEENARPDRRPGVINPPAVHWCLHEKQS